MKWLPMMREAIDGYVLSGRIGVYTLKCSSRDGSEQYYVGRSNNLRTRLKEHLDKSYDAFTFIPCKSEQEAFRLECIRFHDFFLLVGAKLRNTNHPAPPSGCNWKCPVFGCAFSQ